MPVPGAMGSRRVNPSNKRMETGYSVPEHSDAPASRRFAVRRGESGLEFFAAQATRTTEGGEVEYHGYPTNRVPGKVLRRFRDRGDITTTEYRQLVRRLG